MTSVQSVVPAYTNNPPETALQGQQAGSMSSATTSRQQYCANNHNDSACEAVNYSGTLQVTPSLSSNDPALSALPAENSPQTVIGALSSTYTNCVPQQTSTTSPNADYQYCNEYLHRSVSNQCDKTLTVLVTRQESCQAGVPLPATDIVTHGNGDAFRYAGIRVTPACDIDSQIRLDVQAICTEPGCSGAATLNLDPSTGAPAPQALGGFQGRSWFWTDYFNDVRYTGGGCGSNNQCSFSFSTYDTTPPTWDSCTEADNCLAICSDAMITDKRTAAGEQIDCSVDPQQVLRAASSVLRASGSVNFERPHSYYTFTDQWNNLCSGYEARVPPGMLLADGDNSIPPSPTGSTGSPAKCERSSSVCAEPAETRIISGQPVYRACWRWTNAFDCIDNQVDSDCGDPRFGQCSEVSGSPACLQTDVDTGVCLHKQHKFLCNQPVTRSNMTLDCTNQQSCVNGICSNTSHGNDPDFLKAVTMLNVLKESGKEVDQSTLRIFTGNDQRCRKRLIGTFNCCTRSSSGVVQYGCSDPERQLQEERDKHHCADVGGYCSSRSRTLGICWEHTETYCCFRSTLARIINEQGRGQLGLTFGSPQSPSCDGFSIVQLQSLDFSQIDFSDFYQEIMPAALNQTQTQSDASAKVSSCYAGAGRC